MAKKQISRTAELRGGGAERRAGGDRERYPFVKWGDEYCFVEGVAVGFWTYEYKKKEQEVVTLRLTNFSDDVAFEAKDEKKRKSLVDLKKGDTVNVGLSSKMLEGSVAWPGDRNKEFHIAFEGWQEPKDGAGNAYRLFEVLVIGEAESEEDEDEDEDESPRRGRSSKGRKDEDEDEDEDEEDEEDEDENGTPF